MSKHKLGLIIGSFFALIHAVWSVGVALIPNTIQMFANWMLQLHHISLPFTIIQPFSIMNAVMLVIMTFIIGYVFGWILQALINMMRK